MHIKTNNFLNLHLLQLFLLANLLIDNFDEIIWPIGWLVECHDWPTGGILLHIAIIVDDEDKIVDEELACIHVIIRNELTNQILFLGEVQQDNALALPPLE